MTVRVFRRPQRIAAQTRADRRAMPFSGRHGEREKLVTDGSADPSYKTSVSTTALMASPAKEQEGMLFQPFLSSAKMEESDADNGGLVGSS